MTIRYVSNDEDNARWDHVGLRRGDIIVSTRSKHGTTWVQAILLMLIHGPELPAPLSELSPWVDHRIEPIDVVAARLERQSHRRVIKTHTPLDGLPAGPTVHHVVVARHPLDAAVSLYHQAANIDRARLARLTGSPITTETRAGVREWLGQWVRARSDPRRDMDSLDGVFHHLTDAWARRHDGTVTLVHYSDLLNSPETAIRRLAHAVDAPFDDRIVGATTFDAMRQHADRYVPDAHGLLLDRADFFRCGRSGAGVASLSGSDHEHYQRRARTALGSQLSTWLHR